jgi:hypothetical protein
MLLDERLRPDEPAVVADGVLDGATSRSEKKKRGEGYVIVD